MPFSSAERSCENAQPVHWTERGRAASASNSDATGRPRRSVLAFDDEMNSLRRVIFWLAAIVPVLMAIFVLLAAKDAARMAHWDHVQSGMSSLASAVELYRLEHGHYPTSLESLLASSPEVRASLNNRYGDRYTFHAASNGFDHGDANAMDYEVRSYSKALHKR